MSKAPMWLTATFGPPYDIQQDTNATKPRFRHRRSKDPGDEGPENQWTDGLPPKEEQEADA